MTFCGADLPDFPDAGDPGCCYGSAVYGPHRCTCWVPVYDREQAPIPHPAAAAPPPQTRAAPCVDCAFKGGSPERRGAAGFADADSLAELVHAGTPFYCHQGIRRILRWRHPGGMEIDAHPASYEPEPRGTVPYRADGTPADVCAGWAAQRARVLAEAAR